MVTAKDIATKLGVSLSAVSIALNGKSGISEDTRQKILAAAREMGYQKRAWNGKKSSILELLIHLSEDEADFFSMNPFFSRIIEGITSRCQELGYTLQIAYMREGEFSASSIQDFIPMECSGILLLASGLSAEYARFFLSLSIPVVFIDNAFPGLKANCVSIDNQFAVSNVVDYLVSLGHTKIRYVSHVSPIANFQARLNAFSVSLSSHGLKIAEEPIVANKVIGAPAVAEIEGILKVSPIRSTAFVCGNDWLAVACIQALTNLHYRVPEDISVTGFDNIPLSEMIAPGITTVDIPKSSIGVLAVNRITELMGGNCRTVKIQVLADIVKRGSVAPPVNFP